MRGESMSVGTRLLMEARGAGRSALLEPAGFQLLEAAGVRCPRRLYVPSAAAITEADLARLGSSRVAVKVVAEHLAHKSDVGGVAIVNNRLETVIDAVRRMADTFAGQAVAGYALHEFIPYDPSPGGEWLLGLRWTDEFGPVVTLGPGGTATEFLAAALKPGREVAVVSPGRSSREAIAAAVERLALTPLATGGVRRLRARTSVAQLCDAVDAFAALRALCAPDAITDLEVNPLVPCDGELVALDVLVKVGARTLPEDPPRPVSKIRQLLMPASIAIAGVSAQMNAGRAILDNVIRDGFDPAAIHVVKPGVSEIAGCRAVPTIQALPRAVDLLILSIPAAQIPSALLEVVEHRKAESVIVIPGGLEEKAGTAGLVSQMREALRSARATDWRGPVVNGGNCLGVRSVPGRYDTMFIPGHKLGSTPGPASPIAFISQSGAFAVSRTTRLRGIRPRYSITVGNQMDLTVGDYLRYLEDDPEVKVFAVYVEGFKPLDGRAALDAIARITGGGRTVVFYRAGRTAEGAKATASHTASVAGDYVVTRELARAAGAIVAESLDDFTDLVALFTLLESKAVCGRRVGALSNAGYECVAIADHIGDLVLPSFTPQTRACIGVTCEMARIDGLVDVHNPLDVTPMLDDAGYEVMVRYVLEDAHVDVGVVGCVPATGMLSTLTASASHHEDLRRPGAIAPRLVRLAQEIAKPWVAVVDAGPIYDPFAEYLQDGGIPTFRSADRALRLLNVFVQERFGDRLRAQRERCVDEFSRPGVLQAR